jgi:hypothetical protein
LLNKTETGFSQKCYGGFDRHNTDNNLKIMPVKIIICLLIAGFLFRQTLCARDLQLNEACQALLSNPETGLVSTSLDDYDYTYAERNANAIMNALKRLAKNQDLLLPEGTFYVNTILVAKTISGCTVAGAGLEKTTLKHAGLSWDNNTQGDCPLRTEVFMAENVNGFELVDMTIDGNCHHMAISGYGKWNTQTGSYSDGLPQFPTYISNDGFTASSGSVINIRLSKNILFDNVAFKNGFRWCVFLGKINGFTMRNCILDTGNLSTEFKGHFDAAPNNTVMHMHTSQDGLHLVNVSNALIENNDIHSEDSAIAVELNPAWDWGGYDEVENIIIRNNYISTASPTDPEKLLNDADAIYGTGLADVWVGQSAVDIFYNEHWDVAGKQLYKGENGFRNIEIKENAFEGVRQGVRCGFFIGATLGHFNHRIFNLTIKDQEPSFLAGRDRNKPAGIRNVRKNTYPGYNLSGGAGIAVRYTDSLVITNNVIEDVSGGLGISIENVTHFTLTSNRIDNVSGKQLGDLSLGAASAWTGGEGIRVYNYQRAEDANWKNGRFDAGYFLIKDNRIGKVETTRLAVLSTQNGIVPLNNNYDLNGTNLCLLEDGINESNTSGIDWGDCNELLLPSTPADPFVFYPNPVKNDLFLIPQPAIDTNIEIVDLTGKKLFERQLNSVTNVISVQRLSPGVYLLLIKELAKQKQYKLIKK